MARGLYRKKYKNPKTGRTHTCDIWWICYKSADGDVKRESSKSSKFRDAQNLLAKRRLEAAQGKTPEPIDYGRHTFSELAEKYLDQVASRQKSFREKGYMMGRLLKVFGKRQLNAFNIQMLEEYQNKLQYSDLKKPATVNRYMSLIKHMFKKAKRWRWVSRETYSDVRDIELLPENNRRTVFLQPNECRILINSCEPYFRPIVECAIHSGMRKSEILNLEWKQIDLKREAINLEETKNGEPRIIPMDDTLQKTFSCLKSRRFRIDIPYVYYNSKTEKPYHDIRKAFKRACLMADSILNKGRAEEDKNPIFKKIKFHGLRYTFASNARMAGIDKQTRQELLGHKTSRMTDQYSISDLEHKRIAMKLLSSRLSNIR